MKAAVATALLAAALGTLPAHAASDHAGHGMAPHAMAPAEATMVDAQIKKVDKAAGKVTLAHGPLTNLNMPAMTMVFRVKEANWLDAMKTGDKIRFVADNIDGAVTVVRFEPMKR